MHKVFIDGGHGTTGLKINEYICKRSDVQLLEIDPNKRKDMDARLQLISEADVSILCLPDQAAREIAAAAPKDAILIDTSSAHRTSEGWTYGMPELTTGQRDLIRSSTRIANPGCHASGFILIVRPLIDAGLLDRDALLTCFCVTGYSGGGKSMIGKYEAADRAAELSSPGQYALGQTHKHLPEMTAMTGLANAPCFSPVVGDFYSGMVMTVPVHRSQLKLAAPAKHAGTRTCTDIVRAVLADRYEHEALISVHDSVPDDGFIYSNPMSGQNGVEMYVTGCDDRLLLVASYDNLGKGSSGAAIQNMNIVLGTDEYAGL